MVRVFGFGFGCVDMWDFDILVSCFLFLELLGFKARLKSIQFFFRILIWGDDILSELVGFKGSTV